jgi:hypothetical protein
MIGVPQCGKSFQCCTIFGRSDFRTWPVLQRPSFCIFSHSVVRDTRKKPRRFADLPWVRSSAAMICAFSAASRTSARGASPRPPRAPGRGRRSSPSRLRRLDGPHQPGAQLASIAGPVMCADRLFRRRGDPGQRAFPARVEAGKKLGRQPDRVVGPIRKGRHDDLMRLQQGQKVGPQALRNSSPVAQGWQSA